MDFELYINWGVVSIIGIFTPYYGVGIRCMA